jgi:hypothetical protein
MNNDLLGYFAVRKTRLRVRAESGSVVGALARDGKATWLAWGALEKLTADDPTREPAEPVHFSFASTEEGAVKQLCDEMDALYGKRRWVNCPHLGTDHELLVCVHEIVEANKTELSKTCSDWWKGRPEQFVGALTNTVAAKLQKPQWQVRYWLTKLEEDGVLMAHRTPGGITRWYPKTLLPTPDNPPAYAGPSAGRQQPTTTN